METTRGDVFTPEFKRWQRNNIENIVAMLRSLKSVYGDKVIKGASAAYLSVLRQRWRKIADESEERSIRSLFFKLWEDSKNLILYKVTHSDIDLLELRVDSCFWADEFRRLGANDIGYELCCMAEFYVAEVFNPAIVYKRGRCIMNGDELCDHNYSLKK